MKKLLYTMAITFCIMVVAPISAFAASVETAGAIGTVTTTAKMAIENAYDTSVIARMGERAGAHTQNGAKGISFEIMCCDKLNIFENHKTGNKTRLSTSSIDEVVDLVTVNKFDEVVQNIQCKNGTSRPQIDNIVNKYGSNKYPNTVLYCTTETASLVNEKAAAKGISQRAVDTGISTEATERAADKFLGKAPSAPQLVKNIAKNSAFAGAISGGISIAESIVCGDNIYELTGNLVENVVVSTVATAAGTVAAAELPVILTSAGAGVVVANTTATVAAIAIPVAGGYALYMLADEYQLEEKVAGATEDVVSIVSDTYNKIIK